MVGGREGREEGELHCVVETTRDEERQRSLANTEKERERGLASEDGGGGPSKHMPCEILINSRGIDPRSPC